MTRRKVEQSEQNESNERQMDCDNGVPVQYDVLLSELESLLESLKYFLQSEQDLC